MRRRVGVRGNTIYGVDLKVMKWFGSLECVSEERSTESASLW